MERPAEYMDDLMERADSLKLVLGMWPTRRAGAFRVNGLGYHEVFRPKIVNRPGGTRDWLLMQFHSSVSVFAGGRMLDYPPGTAFLWEPRATHRYGNPRRLWAHSWLHCDGPGIDAVFRSSGIPLNQPLHLADTSVVDDALPAIHAEITRYRQPDRVILEGLVEIMVRRLRRLIPGDAAPRAPVPVGVLAARTFIEQNLSAPLKLREVASAARMSVSHLSARFREHLGTPPMRYLLELRLRQAAYLLADRNAGVGEVARAVGFRDPLYFSRQFRRRFGSSPRAYRRSRRP
jgi:AraC-like DNA-binding protein